MRGKRLRQLLAFLELLLPFSQDSSLASPTVTVDGAEQEGPAALIERLTGGILRDIMILLVDASRRAIRANATALSTTLLAKTWASIQTQGAPDLVGLPGHDGGGRAA